MTETTDADRAVTEVIQALTPPPREFPWTELQAQFELENARLDHMFDALRHIPLP